MVAGVAGGVAGRLGVDPLLVRILFVILAFFGVGFLLYGLGWLLLPDDDGAQRSLLEQTTSGRTRGGTRQLLLVAALAGGVAISAAWVLSGQVIPVLLLILALVGLYLYAKRDGADPQFANQQRGRQQWSPHQEAPAQWAQPSRSGSPSGGAAPYATTGGSHAYDPSSRESATPPQPAYMSATSTVPPTASPFAAAAPYGDATATYPGTGVGTAQAPAGAPRGEGPGQYQPVSDSWSGSPMPPSWPPNGPVAPPPVVPPPRPRRPPRERSYLGLLTISVGLVSLGVLAAVDAAGAQVPGTAYVGLALGVVALGLLVGTWLGRSRGLILAGLLLCVVMVPTAFADTATDNDWSRLRQWSSAETVRESPAIAADIRPAYDVGSGDLVLDLRDVDFSAADVRTTLSIGAGEITVLVPREVDVVAAGSIDIGQVVLFGLESGGVDVATTRTNLGGDGVGGGSLDLTMTANVGRLEVRREAA